MAMQQGIDAVYLNLRSMPLQSIPYLETHQITIIKYHASIAFLIFTECTIVDYTQLRFYHYKLYFIIIIINYSQV